MSSDAWERAVTRLRDDLTAAETRIAQLEEALRFYAQHTHRCGIFSFYSKDPTPQDCTCGFVKTMRAALSPSEAPEKEE